MKRKSFFAFAIIMLIIACASMLSGCFGVTPCAWVALDMEGYKYYSSNAYTSGGDHIYLYENEEVAQNDTYHTDCLISIGFYPRILGADTIDGLRTTTVDISGWYEMKVTIKTELYSESKHIYLNDNQLTPNNFYDGGEYFKILSFENFGLVRGNPGGHLNNFVNKIEYK